MTQPTRPSSTPTPPSTKPLRARITRFRNRKLAAQLTQSLLTTLATFITLMLLAMLIDCFAIYLTPTTRLTLTASVIAITTLTFLYQLFHTLRQPRTLQSTARFIETWRPELHERWSTTLNITTNPAATTNPTLTAALINQSNAFADVIDLRNIIDLTPLKRTAALTTLLALILAATFTTPRTQTLARRFLQPHHPITFTNIQTTTNPLAVINEPFPITADLTHPLTPSATLLLRTDNQPPTAHTMHPTDSPNKFTFTTISPNQDFSFAIRSGDNQTPFQSITATHRPQITAITCQSRHYDNTRLITTTQSALPARLTLRKNAELTLTFTANKPLKQVTLNNNTPAIPITLQPSPDNQYVYISTITHPQTLTITLRDHHNLTAAQPITLDIHITPPPFAATPTPAPAVSPQTALAVVDLSNQVTHILNTTAQLTQQPAASPQSRQQILTAASRLLAQAADIASELTIHTQSTSAQPLADHHRAAVDRLIKQLDRNPANPAAITTDINQTRLNIARLTELWQQNHHQSQTARSLNQSLAHHQSFTNHLQPILKQTLAPAQQSAAISALQQSHHATIQSLDSLSSHDSLARQLLARQTAILKRLGQYPDTPLSPDQQRDLASLLETYQREQLLLTQLAEDLQNNTQPLQIILTPAPGSSPTPTSFPTPANSPATTPAPTTTPDFNRLTDRINAALRLSQNTSYHGPYQQTISSYFQNLSKSSNNPENNRPANP